MVYRIFGDPVFHYFHVEQCNDISGQNVATFFHLNSQWSGNIKILPEMFGPHAQGKLCKEIYLHCLLN